MAGEWLTAGTKFKINSTVIPGCYSFPDFITTPERIDTSTFDDMRRRTYKKGLIPAMDMNFDFNDTDNGDNYRTVLALVGEDCSFELTFPNGHYYRWSGEFEVGYLGAGVNGIGKFRIATSVETDIEEGFTTV